MSSNTHLLDFCLIFFVVGWSLGVDAECLMALLVCDLYGGVAWNIRQG